MTAGVVDAAADALLLGDDDRLDRLVLRHAAGDGAALSEWVATRVGAREAGGVAALVASDPRLLATVPGCGGLHLPEDDPRRDHMVAGLALELATRGDEPLTVDLAPLEALYLPLSGTCLRLAGDPAAARCHASRDELAIRWGEADVRIRLSGGAVSQLSDGMAVRVMEPERVMGVRIDTAAAHDLGFAASKAAVRAAGPLHPVERAAIETAFQLLEFGDGGMLRELRRSGTCVTPLASREGLVRQSFSVETLPHVVFCSIDDPFELADVICHEYHHLKLFLVEESQPLLANPDAAAIAPWRRDLRNARGVMHGAYVFFMVAHVFGELFGSFPPSERGLRKLLIWRTAIRFGLAELRRSDARLTAAGEMLVAHMQRGNEVRLRELARTAPGLASWTSEVIGTHVAQAGRADSVEPWYLGL